MQAIRTNKVTAETREAIFNLFAAYLHTVPLEQLIKGIDDLSRLLAEID